MQTNYSAITFLVTVKIKVYTVPFLHEKGVMKYNKQ